MVTYATWETFAANMAVPAAGKSDKHHNALCYFSTKFGAHDYACWAAIQQYKTKQSKRRAIFIFDTWVKDSTIQAGAIDDAPLTMSIFDKVNPGSSDAGKANQEKALSGGYCRDEGCEDLAGQVGQLGPARRLGRHAGEPVR